MTSDTFSQSDAHDDVTGTLCPIPFRNKGRYAHLDGYNVLYGDWSARWYGDPQQRIMWWPGVFIGGVADQENPYAPYIGSPQINSTYSWSYGDGTSGFDRTCNTKIWHTLDMAHDVDVDAD